MKKDVGGSLRDYAVAIDGHSSLPSSTDPIGGGLEVEAGKKLRFNHRAKSLHEVFNIGRRRFQEILDDTFKIFDSEDLVSKAVEKVANKYAGRELVLALLALGFAMGLEASEIIEEDVEVMYIG
ncbi:MAG: hypothetical protein NZ929_03530 [Aigarchaeota archaeon]|nr:hypothetical protein [Aigarchaeota archaeon]MDW7986499.1 hypothetical protein [Nitrososphaerota archaeon]